MATTVSCGSRRDSSSSHALRPGKTKAPRAAIRTTVGGADRIIARDGDSLIIGEEAAVRFSLPATAATL
jgi:hypothetical protein